MGLGPGVWQCTSSTHHHHTAASQRTCAPRGIREWMHAWSLPFVWRTVSLKLPRHPRRPTHSDLFSASIIPSPASRLQHRPGSSQAAQVGAQLHSPAGPAAVARHWLAAVRPLCETVCPAVLPCQLLRRRPWASTTRSSRRRSSAARPRGAATHGRVPSLLG